MENTGIDPVTSLGGFGLILDTLLGKALNPAATIASFVRCLRRRLQLRGRHRRVSGLLQLAVGS